MAEGAELVGHFAKAGHGASVGAYRVIVALHAPHKDHLRGNKKGNARLIQNERRRRSKYTTHTCGVARCVGGVAEA